MKCSLGVRVRTVSREESLVKITEVELSLPWKQLTNFTKGPGITLLHKPKVKDVASEKIYLLTAKDWVVDVTYYFLRYNKMCFRYFKI